LFITEEFIIFSDIFSRFIPNFATARHDAATASTYGCAIARVRG